jgi:hypothetical protein
MIFDGGAAEGSAFSPISPRTQIREYSISYSLQYATDILTSESTGLL